MEEEFLTLKNKILLELKNYLIENNINNINQIKFISTIKKLNKFFVINDTILINIFDLLQKDNNLVSIEILNNLIEFFFKEYYLKFRKLNLIEKIHLIENLRIINNNFKEKKIIKKEVIKFILENNFKIKNETIIFFNNFDEIFKNKVIENFIEKLEEEWLFKDNIKLKHQINKNYQKLNPEFIIKQMDTEFNLIINKIDKDNKLRIKKLYSILYNYIDKSKNYLNKYKILKIDYKKIKKNIEIDKKNYEIQIIEHLNEVNNYQEEIKNLKEKNNSFKEQVYKEIDIYKDQIYKKNIEIKEVVCEKNKINDMQNYYKNELNVLNNLIKLKEDKENINIYENFTLNEKKIKEIEENLNSEIISLNTKIFELEKNNSNLEKKLKDFNYFRNNGSNLKLDLKSISKNSNSYQNNNNSNSKSVENELNFFISHDKLNLKIKESEIIIKNLKEIESKNKKSIIKLKDEIKVKDKEYEELNNLKEENKILNEEIVKINKLISKNLDLSDIEKNNIIKEYKNLKKEIKFLNKDKENLSLEIEYLKKIISHYENKSEKDVIKNDFYSYIKKENILNEHIKKKINIILTKDNLNDLLIKEEIKL